MVEDVAVALGESAKAVGGAPSRFPTLPGLLRPALHGRFFNRVVRQGTFMNAKPNAAIALSTAAHTRRHTTQLSVGA